MYFTDTYADDIKPVMTDWLTNSLTGNTVGDLSLNFSNRALRSLWAERPWSQLEVFTEMTVTNLQYTIPDALGKIIRIAEYDSYGKMLVEYKEGDNPSYGYSVNWGFTKDAGYSGTITFNTVVGSGTLKIIYIKALDKFTGTGTEYSYFPAQLMLLAAQRIAALDKGNVGEWQALTAAYDRELKIFEKATYQVNVDTRPYLRDRAGNEVTTPNYSLGGEPKRRATTHSNKYIGL